MRKTFMCVALAFMGALNTLAKDVVDSCFRHFLGDKKLIA